MWRPNRRELLRAAAVGAAASATATAAAACGDNSDGGRFAGFELAIQSWTFRAYTLDEMLAFVAQLGLTRVELSPQAGHFGFPQSDDDIAAMRAKLAASGLDCVTSGVEPVSGDHEANRAVFEYAAKLGLRTIMVDAPPESLDSLDALVREYDIRIGIHNHGPGSRYSSIADVASALDGRDRRMGCIVDTGHYTRSGEDPVHALRAFEGRVYGVHLKDVSANAPDAYDTILGEGVVDFAGVFGALRDIGVPGDASLSIEYEANLDAYDDVVVCLDNAARAARGDDG